MAIFQKEAADSTINLIRKMNFNKDYVPAHTALADRVILITGASDGIGKALAIKAAQLGATVIAHGKSTKKLEAVDDAIKAINGKRPALLPLDFEKATATEFQAMADAITQSYGKLDGLVHNAAMLGERAPVEHHDVAKWLRAMHVNTNAPFILTRYCIPLLRKSADASIVFTSCEVAIKPRPNWGAYLVAKCANEGMMQMLSQELENTSIRVNSVDPGVVNSRIRMQAYPAENRDVYPKPEDVLDPYLFLLSGDGRQVRGQRINRT